MTATAWNLNFRRDVINQLTLHNSPIFLIDLSTVKRNIARLAEYGRRHKINIRPHTKTHKSIRMARLQLQAGAMGLTAAKVRSFRPPEPYKGKGIKYVEEKILRKVGKAAG